jgi:uncharacterized protein (TIGR03067 family)
METPPTAPVRGSLAAAVTGTLVHAALWMGVGAWLVLAFRLPARQFSDLQMMVPALTEMFLAPSELFVVQPWLGPALVVALLLLDFTMLGWLGQPTSYRVLRELWSGLMAALPLGLALLAVLAVTLPYVKLMEGLTRYSGARSQEEATERGLLTGSWKLVGREQQGRPTAREHLPADVLTFQPGNRYTWLRDGTTEHGAYSLSLMVRPKGFHFMPVDGPHPGQWLAGFYKVEAGRLTILLGAPNDSWDKLSSEFTTRDGSGIVYVLERVARDEK